jgi:cytochrome P450
MTDGPSQLLLKSAMSGALAQADLRDLAATGARCADSLLLAVQLDELSTLAPYMFGLSPLVVATMLGFAPGDRNAAVDWARTFVGSLGANADASEREAGARATEELRACIQASLGESSRPGSLLAALASEAKRHDVPHDAIVANAIGLFLQGYEATAGLIGNVLVELRNRSAALHRSLLEDRALLEAFAIEVARNDSPVQNTRRYAVESTALFGNEVAAGECVLVLLAAANRDPKGETLYTFGSGAHACNGMRIAVTIAVAGVAALLGAGLDFDKLQLSGYLPRPNVRVPAFTTK